MSIWDCFLKTVKTIFSWKHHSHPIVSCVTHQLFIASATYIFHNFCFSCRTFIGHTLDGVPRATKKRAVDWLKMKATFHLRVFHLKGFRPRSIPSRNYKNNNLPKKKIRYKLIIGDKEYKNTGCSTNQNGKRFCIFERRNGLYIDRIKVTKEDLQINHETGVCHLLSKVIE